MPFEIMSWNICYSRRAIGEFEDFAFPKRMKSIMNIIFEQSADIIYLQEVHEYHRPNIEDRLGSVYKCF